MSTNSDDYTTLMPMLANTTHQRRRPDGRPNRTTPSAPRRRAAAPRNSRPIHPSGLQPATIALAHAYAQRGLGRATALRRARERQTNATLRALHMRLYEVRNAGFVGALELERCVEEMRATHPRVVEMVAGEFAERAWGRRWLVRTAARAARRGAPRRLVEMLRARARLVRRRDGLRAEYRRWRGELPGNCEEDRIARVVQSFVDFGLDEPDRDDGELQPLPAAWFERLGPLVEKSRVLSTSLYPRVLKDLQAVYAEIDDGGARAVAEALQDAETADRRVPAAYEHIYNNITPFSVEATVGRFNPTRPGGGKWHHFMLPCIPYMGRMVHQLRNSILLLHNESNRNGVPPASTVLPALQAAMIQFSAWHSVTMERVVSFVANRHAELLREDEDFDADSVEFRDQFGALAQHLGGADRAEAVLDCIRILKEYDEDESDVQIVQHVQFHLVLSAVCNYSPPYIHTLVSLLNPKALYSHRLRNARSALARVAHSRFMHVENVLTVRNILCDELPFSHGAAVIMEGLDKKTDLTILRRMALYSDLKGVHSPNIARMLDTASTWLVKFHKAKKHLGDVLDGQAGANMEYLSAIIPETLETFWTKLDGSNNDAVDKVALRIAEWVLPGLKDWRENRMAEHAWFARDTIVLCQAKLLAFLMDLPARNDPSGEEIRGMVERWIRMRNWYEKVVKDHIRKYTKPMTDRAADKEGRSTEALLGSILNGEFEEDISVEELAHLGSTDDAESRRAGDDFKNVCSCSPSLTVFEYVGQHRPTLVKIAKQAKLYETKETLAQAAASDYQIAMWALENAELFATDKDSDEYEAWQTMLGYRATLFRAESILVHFTIPGSSDEALNAGAAEQEAKEKRRLLQAFDDIVD